MSRPPASRAVTSSCVSSQVRPPSNRWLTEMRKETTAPGAFSLIARMHSTANRARFSGLRSEEHTSELQSRGHLVCRLLLEKKKINIKSLHPTTCTTPYRHYTDR